MNVIAEVLRRCESVASLDAGWCLAGSSAARSDRCRGGQTSIAFPGREMYAKILRSRIPGPAQSQGRIEVWVRLTFVDGAWYCLDVFRRT
ncbi:hypothetical protein BD309DRAFT_80571 [Dichomitus squalens]|nr:hypothetical protein BD309DRAFT_80571 [Dichomitus squalens]TBU61789.1 hypothetical protein BD310DRAFT_946257 [Dichomitus squalens]